MDERLDDDIARRHRDEDERCVHGDPLTQCHGERDDYRHEIERQDQ